MIQIYAVGTILIIHPESNLLNFCYITALWAFSFIVTAVISLKEMFGDRIPDNGLWTVFDLSLCEYVGTIKYLQMRSSNERREIDFIFQEVQLM
jgi:hypothetical protein